MVRQLELLRSTDRRRTSPVLAFIFSVATAALTLFLQAYVNNFLPNPYFFFFFPAAILISWFFGFMPAVLTTVLCVLGANYFYYEPLFAFGAPDLAQTITLGFVGAAAIFTAWTVSRLETRERFAKLAQVELETTLRSIGDAVIVVDKSKNVVFLNPIAEKLTGWNLSEARGAPMSQVFNIVNEKTRALAENPVERVLRDGVVVGLANHTVLISRDGSERPIEDSAAPISMEVGDGLVGVVLVFRDVSERYAAESLTRESEDRLRLALASAKMGTFYIDLKTNRITTSPELARILGYDEFSTDVLDSIETVIHPDDRARTNVLFAEAVRLKSRYENEYRVIMPTGATKWILSRANVTLDAQGNAVAMTGVTVDIDDFKRAEEEVISSERRFATLFDASPLPTLISKFPAGTIVDVNAATIGLLGYTKSELIGKTSEDLGMHVRPELRSIIMDALKSGQGIDGLEIEVRAKDGRVIPIANSVRVVQLAGQAHALTTIIDLTKIRDAESKLREIEQRDLRESERKFRMLANSIPQMAWTADASGRVEFVNQRYTDFTGRSLEDVIEKRSWEIIHRDDRPLVDEVWGSAIRKGTPFDVELRYKNAKTGEYEWFLSRAVPVKNAEGQVESWFGTNTNIQPMKVALQELEAAKVEAERANELKSAFLANMSHEIRTPLGAMIGFADLLRDPGLSTGERESYTEILARNGESLSVIINDILDLSKVEAGQLSLELTDVSPRAIAEDVVSLLRVKAHEKDLAFEFVCGEHTPEKIVSDSVRIRQILLNIVSNAIKFTPYGLVKVHCFGCKTERGHAAVCFEVTDTGIGIPESQKEKVFEMFVQADGSMTRRFGGTGLGLALSKRLAHALGGDVVITRTEPGKGSTFLITIEDQPEKRNTTVGAQRKRPAPVAALKEKALDGLMILVVDDSPDNRQLIWHYLTKQGAIVDTAENGLLGYRQAIAGNYDLVLMDIQMPEMDGYTATHKLREGGYRKPIIALTAHAMSEVRQKCLNVGCSGHLTKPIDPKALISSIVEFTGSLPPPSAV